VKTKLAKIKQHEEKRERNEIYALKFRKKTDEKVEKDTKKRGGKYGAWCRIAGHPLNFTRRQALVG
jgi:hypothetical protein